MRYIFSSKLLLFAIILAVTSGGRRFVVKDGIIQETKIFADENDWMKQLSLEFQVEEGGLSLSPDKLLLQEFLQKSNTPTFHTIGSGAGPGIDTGSYSLRELTKTSIFCISKDGKVYERFFNGLKWVYMPHLGKPQKIYRKVKEANRWEYQATFEYVKSAVAITTVITGSKHNKEFHGYRGVVIADENGHLYQREPTEKGVLRWVDISIENVKVFSGGVCGAGQTFFVSSTGILYERNFRDNSWLRHQDLPGGNKIAVIIDVFTLIPTSVFVLSVSGSLFQLDQTTWIDHGYPPEGPLTLKPAVVLQDLNSIGSFFLVSAGNLVEYWWNNDEKAWKWMSHGAPEGHRIMGAPGALKHSKSLFMVSSKHELLERLWNGKKWIWVEHGSPSLEFPLSYSRPVYVSYHSVKNHVLAPMENGLLGAYVEVSDYWEWQIVDVPEDGGAPYCSTVPGSENSCVKSIA